LPVKYYTVMVPHLRPHEAKVKCIIWCCYACEVSKGSVLPRAKEG